MDEPIRLPGRLSEARDSRNLRGRHDQAFVITPDPELGALTDILLLGPGFRRGVVHPDIQDEQAAFILTVVASHVGQRPVGLDHDGDSVQLRVTRVKDVTRHCALDRGAEEPVERGRELGGD